MEFSSNDVPFSASAAVSQSFDVNTMQVSPGSTMYCTPDCDPAFKPRVGMLFNTLRDGMRFYEQYAKVCGFESRKSSQKRARDGVIVWKHMVCNRQGFKNVSTSKTVAPKSDSCKNVDLDNEFSVENEEFMTDIESCESDGSENEEEPHVEDLPTPGVCVDDDKKTRRTVSNRCDCKARPVFRLAGMDGYQIKLFEERHNHSMSSPSSLPFLKVNRKLDIGHQKFVLNCVKANIGTMKCYRLYKETVGGYANIGATSVDFKNFKRDLKAYLVGVDAQMLIDKLFRKKEICSAFSFDYDVDESDQLTRVFWADPVSIKNYALFGDVVSFDATYETNRYDMVFAPFTGVDNHKKCITFAVGLLSKEDVESYVWLFRCFLNAMGREPKCIITDQDPSMKIAIPQVFTNTCHRFCMWHIMEKVSKKVGPVLSKNSDFMTELNSIVWSHYLQPTEFELRWTICLRLGICGFLLILVIYLWRACSGLHHVRRVKIIFLMNSQILISVWWSFICSLRVQWILKDIIVHN
ncbi:unnamed protein product [Cuscuta epithymum]|uniref:Protein FAR1-RELATED SEQUENCE n=1 Tax=Cuscuta epithymum TaxID=186058 RepID=A0AAV0BZ71_9ASTE|nr:unnamed protein product [Cuscuta epithymum]